MENQDFNTTILIDKTPQEAYNAINNVRGWWSEEIEGFTDMLNSVYYYHYKDVHCCTIKLVELVPGKRVVWQVLDNHFNFIADKTEWIGNIIVFDIAQKDDRTEVKFIHHGLVAEYECFNVCFEAWTNYIQHSLRNLIETGKGEPNPKEGAGYNAQLAEKWNLNEQTASHN
ncbi:MAG: SRPBCC domain-containing protein [Bacteroidetes bacterium]|nr:SRPBCC domain-containing protein [Bacteroidota bacterium]